MIDKKPFSYLVNFALGALSVFLAVLVISELVSVQNKIKEGRYIGLEVERSVIDVQGQGEVWATPDLAQVTLGVITENNNLELAQTENTRKMNELTEFLKNLGIEEKDLKTTQYSIQPRYEFSEKGVRVFVGYEISQNLEVKIRDFDNIGEVLGRASNRGANRVGSLSFTFDDPTALEQQARKLAIEDAKAKAQTIAVDLGVTLFRVTGFSEGFIAPWQYDFRAAAPSSFEALPAAKVPQIQAGENAVRSFVTITYEIY